MKPLVVYQCIVNRCGLQLLGIVLENGRPRVGVWMANTSVEMARPGGGTSWRILGFLDTPPQPAEYETQVADLEMPDDLKAYILDDLNRQRAVLDPGWLVSCRRHNHGPWAIPTTVMLEHWNQARSSSRPPAVKLDNASPWKV